MNVIADFFVPGIPQPGGSKKAFPHAKTGRIMVVDANANAKAKPWKPASAVFAQQAYSGAPVTEPVSLDVHFQMRSEPCQVSSLACVTTA